MKIIDFERKGNVVRFYLGDDDCNNYWGDDWDDAPYEHNAGCVYNEYVNAHKDIAFPYDYAVLEPCDGEYNSGYSKEDMKNRKVPCIIAVPPEKYDAFWGADSFSSFIGCDGIIKFYFGDAMDGKEPKEDNLKICKHSNGYGYCSLHEGYCCESPCADEELIEYVLLVHGEWKEYDGTDRGYHYCTNCEHQAFNYGENGNVIEVLSDFCPRCGAKMDGGTTNDKKDT